MSSWLENFLALVSQYYRPSIPAPGQQAVVNTSTDIAPVILANWGMEVFNQGKIKIRSGQYKLASLDSLERFALWAKVGSRHRPYQPYFRECGHFAADLMGQFIHHWPGQFFGCITFALPGGAAHEVNITFSPDLELRFWNPQDEIWIPNQQVLQGALDQIWHP